MQCVPWPLPSWTGSPSMNERVTGSRPAKSGWVRSKPVSSTATRTPAPECADSGTRTACRPQVDPSSGSGSGCVTPISVRWSTASR